MRRAMPLALLVAAGAAQADAHRFARYRIEAVLDAWRALAAELAQT